MTVPTRKRQIYAAIAVYGTLIAFVIIGYLYIGHVQQQADKRNDERVREICGLIRVLDDAYLHTPPQTQVGKNVAAEMHAYRLKLGC